MIKITIPRQKGCVRIDDSKENLTPAEMSALDSSEHKPVKALINFCVTPIVGECTKGTFHPPMKIEVKHDPDSEYIYCMHPEGNGSPLQIREEGRFRKLYLKGKDYCGQGLPTGLLIRRLHGEDNCWRVVYQPAGDQNYQIFQSL